MRILVIGNQDAVWGFALTGIRGKIVATREEVIAALNEALSEKDLGIVLITEDVAKLARQHVDHLMTRSIIPLIAEIPGPEGPDPNRPPLSEIIRQTIGVKI